MHSWVGAKEGMVVCMQLWVPDTLPQKYNKKLIQKFYSMLNQHTCNV